MLLRAWPRIHPATGARLRLIGTDPLQYRLLHTRMRVDEAGIDVLDRYERGAHPRARARQGLGHPCARRRELRPRARRGFACATPVSPPTYPGYTAVAIPEASRLVPPTNPDALADAVIDVLSHEPRRVEMGRAARAHALANYAWGDVARRIEEVYLEVTA